MKDNFNNLISLWKNYNFASALLTEAMGGTANEVGEFAEKLVAEYYNASQLAASNKSADLITIENKYIQVKSRKLDVLKTTSLNVIRSWDFDILVVVLFSKDGNILKAIEISAKDAQKIAKINTHQNGDILTTNSDLLNHINAVDITFDLQAIINGKSAVKIIQDNPVSAPKEIQAVKVLPTINVFEHIYNSIYEDIYEGKIKIIGTTPMSVGNGKIRFGNDQRTESKKNISLLFKYFTQNQTKQVPRERDSWFKLIIELTEGKTKTIDYTFYADFIQEMLKRYYILLPGKN